MLVYGWIREQTEAIPTDLMNECVSYYKQNVWIRPTIKCTDGEYLSEKQLKYVTLALLYSYEKDQSLAELIHRIRNILKEYGIDSLVKRQGIAAWSLRNLTKSRWMLNEHSVTTLCTEPPPESDEISCSGQGNMRKKQCDIIRNIFEQCSKNEDMTTSNICEGLQRQGIFGTVVKNDTETYCSYSESLRWSKWESTKHGSYLILMQNYVPKLKFAELLSKFFCLSAPSETSN